MEIKKTEELSAIKRYWNIIQHGMFLFGLRNRLASLGIDIKPYYWVQEEVVDTKEPSIKGDVSDYHLRYISIDEIKVIYQNRPAEELEELVRDMESGHLCVGLECKSEIVAYMTMALDDFEFGGRIFKIKSNEAYLYNMWTIHAYRGRNLAPYLRYQAFKLLREQGRDVKYSITEYFNKSSIKFKKKLNSKNIYLYLNIILFKKYKWNYTLKKY